MPCDTDLSTYHIICQSYHIIYMSYFVSYITLEGRDLEVALSI